MAHASITLLKPLLASALFFLLFTHAPTCNAQCRTQSILYSRGSLRSGESLLEGPYSFAMQRDCNLVLFDRNKRVWASNTGGRDANCHLALRKTGNLEIMTPEGRRIWTSNTGRVQGSHVLILQRDRNVVIYGPSVWATKTNVQNLNRNGDMMSAVIINALDETNNGTTNLIKTVV